jgi:N6-L-threonylcarbamoyladenine synthase
MKILGIETSCDETAAAVVTNDNNRIQVLSNIVSSSQELHVKYGGVLPDQAAREQQKMIIPVINQALAEAGCSPEDIDAIAITQGPGLIGSLLVGVETAKTLSLLWQKPLIPINHLLAHFYANWITDTPAFPIIGLLVSGGHTDIIKMTEHGEYQYLGGTRDDAAGECFDKCARLLELPYPGGPNLSKLAESGDPKAFNLPRPMWDSKDLDLSFSGLKTAVSNLISSRSINKSQYADVAASVEQAIVDILISKVVAAMKEHNIEQVMLAGGVASNRKLREAIAHTLKGKIYIPEPSLCTDNAVTTATAALFISEPVDPLQIQANPNLSLS